MIKTSRHGALTGLLGLFVVSQLTIAVLAVTGHHRHAWDAGAHEPVCWVCLVISLTAVTAVVGAALSLKDDSPRTASPRAS